MSMSTTPVIDALFAKVAAPGVQAPQTAGIDPPQESPAKIEEAPKPKEDTSLAESIRRDREAREARRQHDEALKTKDATIAELQRKLQGVSKQDILEDPAGWAEAHNLTADEVGALGEMLLYSLVPDKADANTRIRLLEAKQKRKERLAEESRRKSEEESQRTVALETQTRYFQAVTEAAKGVTPEQFPDSVTWFGEDREAYAASLHQTALNMAEAAKHSGQMANLTFENVAKELERHLSERAARFRKTAKPVETPAPPAKGTSQPEQPSGLSTTEVRGGGSPRPPALTERERIERAAAVFFGGK